ncbi:MAG: tRNA uridine-5-carboxymethylaminomethyl(34) synthesis enzyme MnmG [Candidatus Marinimicrobia bacterium]|nr:tRNA uridine-5-carboxymethylaminomethyl(34) synthesis enzyme MnmG [Candidatus Neomarinimicrobiota bacterium]
MKQKHTFDVLVAGGGHAGIEASLISAKLGLRVLLVTIDTAAIGRMSCNPAIGGLAKGQIVREIDSLGGVMGKFSDKSGIQFKMLNKKKGRSVWSPRAQVDKRKYEHLATSAINKASVKTIAGEVVSLVVDKYKIQGAVLRTGEKILCRSIIITCGTFLSGVVHIGNRKVAAGRMGENPSVGLTESLVSLGFKSGRLKTGTPPRINKNTIDWKKTKEAFGDSSPVPFSYSSKNFNPPNIPCHTVTTTNESHEIIKENMSSSPMFSGEITGVGPRYCPSIEDKIHRFSHQKSHTLFLEPEWVGSDQIYINGFSTSLPESAQLKSIRAIPALKRCDFLRPGYAIEYDFFHPAQLKSTLESKNISGLFFAGQINGTSGYEEAAAQGLISGINATSYIKELDYLVLPRNAAYIGVMIDDLITKDAFEPYRMFTSRAEFRLLLRYSNSEERLFKTSDRFNLLSTNERGAAKQRLNIKNQIRLLIKESISPGDVSAKKPKIKQKQPASTYLKRADVSIWDLPKRFLKNRFQNKNVPGWALNEIFEDVESEIKYEGYIKRHSRQISALKKNENMRIPQRIRYESILGLSSEAKEKLSFVRPENIGQAMRISGLSSTDISIVMVNIGRF